MAPASRFIELSEPLASYGKCLYAPVLAGQFERSNVEEPFSRLLDADPTVAVWLKNGDHGQEHFAIKYELDGIEGLFYPDFLVKTTTGGIRMYDTKGAGDSELSTGNSPDTHAKARALQAYLKALREQGMDVGGGIVVRRDERWFLHSGEDYSGSKQLEPHKPGYGWAPFEVLLG